MEWITILLDYANILNFIAVVLVLPFLHRLGQHRNRDSQMLQSIEKATRNIELLRREMLENQRRHARLEDAILYLSDERQIKKVIAILRGHEQEDKE